MRFFEDEYVRHYFKVIMIGVVIVGLISILFYIKFQPKYDIELSGNVFTYGSKQTIVDRVESVGGETVKKKNKISSNTIKMKEYEITFDAVDTYEIGEQKIKARFSDSNIESQSFLIKVVDKEKPSITFVQEEPYEMELKDVEKENWKTFYVVDDNATDADDIKTQAKIKEKNYKEGDTVHLIIKAKDASGNKNKKSFLIHIKEKKVEETKTEDSSSKEEENDTQKESSSQSENSNSTKQTQTTTVTEPRPSNRTFLFSDGYDMESAPIACESALNSSSYGGSCTPLQDSEGIYYGMQLTWN